MKEILLQLLSVANTLHPMRGIHTDWFTVGCFPMNDGVYSFMIQGNRGTVRRTDKSSYTNEWFDVAYTVLANDKRRYTSIIWNGKKYDLEPTIQFEEN